MIIYLQRSAPIQARTSLGKSDVSWLRRRASEEGGPTLGDSESDDAGRADAAIDVPTAELDGAELDQVCTKSFWQKCAKCVADLEEFCRVRIGLPESASIQPLERSGPIPATVVQQVDSEFGDDPRAAVVDSETGRPPTHRTSPL